MLIVVHVYGPNALALLLPAKHAYASLHPPWPNRPWLAGMPRRKMWRKDLGGLEAIGQLWVFGMFGGNYNKQFPFSFPLSHYVPNITLYNPI